MRGIASLHSSVSAVMLTWIISSSVCNSVAMNGPCTPNPCVVDHDVQLHSLISERTHERGRGTRLREIQDHDARAGSELALEPGRECIELRFAACDQHEIMPIGREQLGELEPDAARCPGDEGRFAEVLF